MSDKLPVPEIICFVTENDLSYILMGRIKGKMSCDECYMERSDDIVKIILFGSVARGDDTEESDIDILIITTNSDELSDEINSAAVDIILEKDEFISPHVMSEEHFNKTIDYPFLTNVLKEGVVIERKQQVFIRRIPRYSIGHRIHFLYR